MLGIEDLNRGYGFDEEAVARDAARMRKNTWHVLSIAINSQSQKVNYYVDGAFAKSAYRRYVNPEPWAVAGGLSVMVHAIYATYCCSCARLSGNDGLDHQACTLFVASPEYRD